MGWPGKENGALLGLAANAEIDALMTVDRGIAHQQNWDDLPLPVIMLLAKSNRPDDLRPVVPKVNNVLSGACISFEQLLLEHHQASPKPSRPESASPQGTWTGERLLDSIPATEPKKAPLFAHRPASGQARRSAAFLGRR